MKKNIRSQVTVPMAKIREILAAVASQSVGEGQPDRLVFDIGDATDTYGFIETGPPVLRGASIVIRGHPVDNAGMSVLSETTVEFEKDEIAAAVADHVSRAMSAEVSPHDVHFSITPRHAGEHGYDGPSLDNAIVTVKRV